MAAVINISVPKNRLYIKLEGYFPEDEARLAADQVILEAKKLRPGFGLVSEISEFKPASPQAAEHILRAQRAMKELGVRRMVRVVGGNAMGKMQMQRTATQAGLEAEYAATREEADRMLDQPS